MDKTLFYAFGITLVVSAVTVSGIGLRFPSFPPNRRVLAAVTLYFAALVGATTTFAVLNARAEQRAREAEQTAPAQTAAGQTTTGGQTGSTTTTAGAAAGKQVFLTNGCGGCHTLKAAGTNGSVGPNLDQGLKSKTASFIRQSIVDPNANVTKGFPANTMPQDFGQKLSSSDLNSLVAFLVASTGAKQ